MTAHIKTRQGQEPAAHPLTVFDGEIVPHEAVISAQDMAYMNFAREEFQRLDFLLHKFVLPALGSYSNPLCSDIARHLNQVRQFSCNFCWKHRAVGAAHDAQEVRP